MGSSLVIVLYFLTAMALFAIHCSGKDCSDNYAYSVILLLLTGQCSFEYLTQPPSTTLQGCNPYADNERILISLECTVRRAMGVNTSYSIRWFRENTTGAVKNLGIGVLFPQQGTDRTSRYHETAFLNQEYSPSLLGKYWCQVINKTADPDQPLMRSNVFTLLAPGNYCESKCSEVQIVHNIVCADLQTNSIQAEIVSSTSIVTSAISSMCPSQEFTGTD